MRIAKLLFVVFALVAVSAVAQEPNETTLELPECDIFLFEISAGDGGMVIENGRNITNRKGYDNQPWFTPESRSILYSANHDPTRTDVFEYMIESKQTKQVTDSPTQEYSPQISPDNKRLSYVTDGETANQSVWVQDRSGENLKWLMENQGEREPVGYYSWDHETGHVLFWSRYGFSMRLVHAEKKQSFYVTGNAIPTTPHLIPGTHRFSFMHQQGNGEVWIKELDPETRAVRPLTAVIGSNRNYCWTPDGAILMCDGTRLNRWTAESDSWELVGDLADHQVTSVTRVAVSPDGKKLAVVGLPESE